MGIMTSPLGLLDAVFGPKINAVRAGAEKVAVGNPTREELLARVKDIPVEAAFRRERRTARMSFAFTERERTLFTHAFLELETPRDPAHPCVMTKEEFVECWTAARGWQPSIELVDTVATLFPGGRIDAVDFTRACALDVSETDRVPFAVSFTQEERRRYDGVVELIYYVPFVVLMAYMLISLREMPAAFQLYQGVADNMIDRRFVEPCTGLECTQRAQRVLTYRTVSEPAYFYEWLRKQVIPTLWSGGDNDRADTLTNQRIIGVGALHLQQQRVDGRGQGYPESRRRYQQFFEQSGPTPEERVYIDTFFNTTNPAMWYYPQGSLEGLSQAPFGDLTAMDADTNMWDHIRVGFNYSANTLCGGFSRGHLSNYYCDGHTLDIPLSFRKKDAIHMVNQLERYNWLDRGSRFVAARAVFFQKDTQLFGRLIAGYEIATGGMWLPVLRAHQFRYFTFSQQSIAWIFFFMLFLGWLGWNIVSFAVSLIDVVRESADSLGRPFSSAFDHGACNFLGDFVLGVFPRSLLKAYTNDGWLFIDTINYGVFIVVWFWRARAWTQYSGFDVWNNDRYPREVEHYATTTSKIDYVESINIVLSFLRLLKNLRVFPVLRRIYKTIGTAAVDLYGMAFTAFVLFVAFALSGFVAYGALLPEFSTMVRAITTILRFIIGDFDYSAWEDAQAVMSPIYFSLLQIMLVIIVLEFITAIIADTFADISQAEYKADYIRNVIEADLRTVLTADVVDSPKRHPIALELVGGVHTVTSYMRYFVYLCEETLRWCKACCRSTEQEEEDKKAEADEEEARKEAEAKETHEEKNERLKSQMYGNPPIDSALWVIGQCERKPKRLFAYLEQLVRRMYFENDDEAAEALLLLYEIIFELESREDVRNKVSRQLSFTLASSHCNTASLTSNLPAMPRNLVAQLVSRLGMHHYPFLVTVGIHLPHAISHLPRVSRFVSLFEAHATWSTAVRNESLVQYENSLALNKLEKAAAAAKHLAGGSSDDDDDGSGGGVNFGASGTFGASGSLSQFDDMVMGLTAAHGSGLDDGTKATISDTAHALMAVKAAAHKLHNQAAAALGGAAAAASSSASNLFASFAGTNGDEALADDDTLVQTEETIMEVLRIKSAFSGMPREHVDQLYEGWSNITDREVKLARVEAFRARWVTVREEWELEASEAFSVDREDEEELVFGKRPQAAAAAASPTATSAPAAAASSTAAATTSTGSDDDEEMVDLAALGTAAGKKAFDPVEFFDRQHKKNILPKLRMDLACSIMTQGWTERKKKQFGRMLTKLREAVAPTTNAAATASAAPGARPADDASAPASSGSAPRKLFDDDTTTTSTEPAADPAAAPAAPPNKDDKKDGWDVVNEFNPAVMAYNTFERIWTKIVGATPSSQLAQGVEELSQMENGHKKPTTINADIFEQYCVVSTDAHSRTSIHSHYFEVQHEKMFNTVQLILYLPFVVFFTLLLLLQQQDLGTYSSYSVKRYVTREYKSPDMREFLSTSSQDHWRNWMDQGVFSSLLRPTANGGPYLDFPGYSFLVGGIRVRQFRARGVEDCGFPASTVDKDAADWINFADPYYVNRTRNYFPSWCVPRWPISIESTARIVPADDGTVRTQQVKDAFTYSSCSTSSLAFQEGLTGYFRTCGGYTIFFPANQSRTDAMAALDSLMPDWLDVSTRALVTDFFTYSFNDNIFVRTMVLAEIGAGGGWNFRIKQDPFRLFTFAPIGEASKTYIVVMVLFMVVYIMAFVTFIIGTVHDARHLRHRRSCTWLSALGEIATNMWWTVELIIYLLLAGSWLTRFFFMSATASAAKMYVNQFPDALQSYSEAQFAISVMESINTFFIYVRIFYFVRLHSKLNVLPKTLEKAGGYMLSILVISVIVMTAFGLAGHVVYGPTVLSMSSVGNSMRTLALTVFENGDFDTWLLDKPVWTVIYFSLFTLVCVQILFNMITSVLARAYSDAKDERFNPLELRHVSSVDSTVLGSARLFPAIVLQEMRYRFFGIVRAWQGWRGAKRINRKRHDDVLKNPYTFFRFMDETTMLVEQGSPRQQSVASGNLLVTMVLLRQTNKREADALAKWRKAVAASPARLQVYGIERPTLLRYVSDQLPSGCFDRVYFWCMQLPMTFLGVSPADAAQDLLEANAVWTLSAQKYLDMDSDAPPSDLAERDEKLGELVGSLTKSAYKIIADYKSA